MRKSFIKTKMDKTIILAEKSFVMFLWIKLNLRSKIFVFKKKPLTAEHLKMKSLYS